MPTDQRFVIVGAGLAGAMAAQTLREEGFDGRLVLIGDEPERPYERPPLSKDYLRGESRGEALRPRGRASTASNEIELWTSTRVVGLDTGLQELLLEGDRRLGYDRLLLATGAVPRRLDVPGAELDGIHYLRTLADSEAIAERIERQRAPGRRRLGLDRGRDRGLRSPEGLRGDDARDGLAAPGAGARAGGRPDLPRHPSRPRGRVPARDHGRALRGRGRGRAGGDPRRRLDRDRLRRRRRSASLRAAGLAEAAGIRIDNGIVVDERLETSVPGVFAAGDVANAHHPFYGRRIRVEHWANALEQGEVAARAMLGQPVAYDEIPYFFSDQYDVGMEYSGYATSWDEVVFRGDVAAREFVAFWLEDSRVVAGMNVNVWDVNEPIRELIRSRQPVERRSSPIPMSRSRH